MHNRATLLAGICGLVLSASALQPAMAAAPMGFAGTFGAGYGSSSCDGCDSTDLWNINGSGAFGFGPNVGGEIDASYNNVSGSGFDVNIWGVGGSIFWAPGMFRAGGTVQYAGFSESGFDFSTFSYGAFGEFFAGDFITLAAKGGGLTVDVDTFGSESGGYVGAALIGYILPNLAITPSIDFASISDVDVTNYGIGAEFLVSQTVPISIFAAYSHSNVSVSGFGDVDGDTWMIGLKFYTNGNGVTLVERQRNGTLGWAGSSNFNSIFQAF